MTALLRSVLSSPFHRLASSRYLTFLEVDNTEVDKPQPIRYLRHDHDLFLVFNAQHSELVSLLDGNGDKTATVQLRGTRQTMYITKLQGENLDHAVIKYLQRYPRQWRQLDVHPQADAKAVQAAAQEMIVIRLSPAMPFVESGAAPGKAES